MAKKRKTWINRFPICAMVYKEAAQLLGYSEGEAKSLGLTRAIFFAAAKAGFKAGGAGKPKAYTKRYEDQKKDGIKRDAQDQISFAGIGMYIVEINGEGELRGIIGGKISQPEQYDNQVKDKMVRSAGEKAYTKLQDYVVSKLNVLSKAELNSALIFEIYKEMRDDVRMTEFIEENDACLSAEANIYIAKPY